MCERLHHVSGPRILLLRGFAWFRSSTDVDLYSSVFLLRSLELSPFNVKSLLRRAAAYEAMERYRPAYIDYKTALQISCNITAAHDGTNR